MPAEPGTLRAHPIRPGVQRRARHRRPGAQRSQLQQQLATPSSRSAARKPAATALQARLQNDRLNRSGRPRPSKPITERETAEGSREISRRTGWCRQLQVEARRGVAPSRWQRTGSRGTALKVAEQNVRRAAGAAGPHRSLLRCRAAAPQVDQLQRPRRHDRRARTDHRQRRPTGVPGTNLARVADPTRLRPRCGSRKRRPRPDVGQKEQVDTATASSTGGSSASIRPRSRARSPWKSSSPASCRVAPVPTQR